MAKMKPQNPDANRDPITGQPVGTAGGAFAGGGAERINPTVEDTYWRDNYSTRPYITKNASYDDYGPAYRYGYERYPQHRGKSWEQVENDMERDWERFKGKSRLTWTDAKHATKDAWIRVKDAFERAMPGDSDRDGK